MPPLERCRRSTCGDASVRRLGAHAARGLGRRRSGHSGLCVPGRSVAPRPIDKLRPVAQTFVVRANGRPPEESLALRSSDFDDHSPGAHRRLRGRVTAWGRSVVQRLKRLGLEFTVAVSRDSGAERLLLLGASTAALALEIDGAAVRVGFELPAVLVRAAQTRLGGAEGALRLVTALEQLPEQFVIAVTGDTASYVAPRATLDELGRSLDRAGRSRKPLWIGWTIPRDTALEHAVLLDEQLADALVALARVLLVFTSDACAETEEIAREPAEGPSVVFDGPSRGASATPRDRRHAHRSRGGSAASSRREARRRADGDDGDAEHEGELEIDRRREAPAPNPLEQPAARGIYRAVKVRLRYAPPIADALAPIGRGTRVRVLKGPFSGKVGLVSEVDGKGGARVMLGLLAVRLNVEHLTPLVDGGRRPVLSTSHRKPAPVRS